MYNAPLGDAKSGCNVVTSSRELPEALPFPHRSWGLPPPSSSRASGPGASSTSRTSSLPSCRALPFPRRSREPPPPSSSRRHGLALLGLLSLLPVDWCCGSILLAAGGRLLRKARTRYAEQKENGYHHCEILLHSLLPPCLGLNCEIPYSKNQTRKHMLNIVNNNEWLR